jgi:hypothetical protein
MKNKLWILVLFTFGCQTQKVERTINLPPPPLPDLPKHFVPPTSPPNFTPDIRDIYNIQINPVPHPLNITHEYVIWVNKKRVPLNMNQLESLVKTLDLKLHRPNDTAEIHNGAGWLKPFDFTELE